VLIGPSGAGKGTVARHLTEADPSLWLSRSWTTRAPRGGETEREYNFVDRPTFEARVQAGGFLEWAEFLGNLYGTPLPDPPAGSDVLLEIDLQGARQIVEHHPAATVVMLVPPSDEVRRQRLEARGDSPEQIEQRMSKGREEVELGATLAAHVVVNDDVDTVVGQLRGIVDAVRSATCPGSEGRPR
jgi:guanylate kinase